MKEGDELHVIFRGRVQGVGFRWTIQAHAEERGIKGEVQNLSNGAVEMVAQGEKEKLQELLEAIKKDPGQAKIDSIEASYRSAKSNLAEFHIRF